MDLNKKLEDLKPQHLNCNVFDVYSYNGLTMQDLLCQFFTKINECVQVSNNTIDLTKELIEIGLPNEVAKQLSVWINDGTFEKMINSTLLENINNKVDDFINEVDGKIISKAKSDTVVSNLRNTEGFIQQIMAVCKTYTDNFHLLQYGNRYTAYDEVVQQVGSKYELDCSSFINLLIHGVTFYNSRYNNKCKNVNNPLFFNKIDSYKYRLANQIAKYCVENGYAFTPLSDLSDLRAGDLIFFSWEDFDTNPDKYNQAQHDFHNNAFMKIDHVAMYLDKKNDDIHQTIQYEQYTPQFLYDVNNKYMSQCVLAARLPFANIENYDLNNLIVNGNKQKVCDNALEIGTYYLTKPLEKDVLYTFSLNGRVTSPNSYFIIQANGKTVYSDYGRVETNGTYAYYFLYNQETPATEIKVLIGSSDTENTQRNGYINWCALNEGYKVISNKKQVDDCFNVREIPLTSFIQDRLVLDGFAYTNNLVESDKCINITLNLPVNEDFITNEIQIGNLGFKLPKSQRIPCNLISNNNVSTAGVIQFSYDGTIKVVKFDSSATWRFAIASGVIIK